MLSRFAGLRGESAMRRAGRNPKPRLLLSTIPFLALLAAMAILAVGIMIVAWPGGQPQATPRPVAQQQGVAAKGWFQEAEKDFRKR